MIAHGVVHWFELAIPIFLVVWIGEFNVSMALLGLIVALGYAPFGIGALPAGLLVDRYGPKKPIIACLGGMSISFLLLGFSDSIYAIAFSLLLWGATASLYHPAGLALISTGVKQRGVVFAWHGIAGNVGIALGPFATATILLFFEWQLVALVIAIPGILATAYGFKLQFDPTAALNSEDVDKSIGKISLSEFMLNSKRLFANSFILVFIIVTLVGLYYRGVLTYLPEILSGLPVMEGFESPGDLFEFSLGDYFYVWLLVAGMAGQYMAGNLTSRVAVGNGLATIFAFLGLLAVAFVPVTSLGFLTLFAFCGVLGFMLFAIEPFYQEAVAVYTPAKTRGLSYGYTYLGMFGLGAASISLGGLLLNHLSLGAFFISLAVIALVGFLISTLTLVRNH